MKQLARTAGALYLVNILTGGFAVGFVYSVAVILAPDFASHLVPWAQLPILFGEGSLCVTLLVIGVNLPRWKARAAADA
jgi:hypothetical protein